MAYNTFWVGNFVVERLTVKGVRFKNHVGFRNLTAAPNDEQNVTVVMMNLACSLEASSAKTGSPGL